MWDRLGPEVGTDTLDVAVANAPMFSDADEVCLVHDVSPIMG